MPNHLQGSTCLGYTYAMRTPAILLGAFVSALSLGQKPITLTILHSNDLHSHMEPTAIKGKTYGGYARQATIIKQTRKKEKNVLLLNAGDCFQGTLYFNMYDGLADLAFMNAVGYDAQCAGNHEFDKGADVLAAYVKRAKFPVLSCNLDTSNFPVLAPLIKPSAVVTIDKQKIGIVGVTTSDLENLTTMGTSLKASAHLPAVQRAVDDLTKQGVNKIIVISHIGYEEDQALARGLHDVDLIVGGHSHTPLGTPALDGWRPSFGAYPTYVKDSTGTVVPVVQAWEWGKVFGRFKAQFDAKGHLLKILNPEPIVVDESVPEDPDIASLIDAFRKPIEAMGNTQIGTSTVALTDRTKVGYLVVDSYLDATSKLGAVAALVNPGGVRANLEAGKLTFAMLNSVCPFRNTLTIAELTGAQLVDLLNDSKGSLIPSKNFRYSVAGGSVRDLMIDGASVDPAATYKVTVNNFMAGGGDSLTTLKTVKKLDTGLVDLDAFVEFIKKSSPIGEQNEIRVAR